MFLSKLELNPRCKQVQSELRDPYQMHRTLSKAFDDTKLDYKDARCLFRVDDVDYGRKLYLLVQSKTAPEWNKWNANENYLAALPTTKEYAPVLKTGDKLAFKLRANPTVKRDGKRVGIYKEEERLDWLERKSESSGFLILEARVVSEMKQKSRTTNDFAAVFSAATFSGVLRVMDPDKLMIVLENGLGSGKGFGFGMLSIARLR